MTPEQMELLSMKCNKQEAKQADLTGIALRGAINGLFGGQIIRALDLFDAQLGAELESNNKPQEMTPKTRRLAKYGKWNWPNERLIPWLVSRNKDLRDYYSQDEVEQYGICLLKGNKDDKN
jgi:hypothetical protein